MEKILPAHDFAPCLNCECDHPADQYGWRHCVCKHTVTSGKELREKSNHRYQVTPEVGMGVTMPCGSDRYPGTVTWVSENKKSIRVAGCGYKRTDNNGMSECQTYVFFEIDQVRAADEGALYTLRKNGYYVRQGDEMRHGAVAVLGHRDAHWDPHF